MVLYIEIGDIDRFDSVEKLVACAGPDLQVEQSGDQVSEKGISKRGNRYIRSVLYGCVTAAIRGGRDPPAGRLFDPLKAKGKHRKAPLRSPVCFGLVAIVYGCWSNGERFDPQHKRLKASQEQKAPQEQKRQDDPNESDRDSGANRDLSAPISQREATQRKKAPCPQKSGSFSDRGQGAFP